MGIQRLTVSFCFNLTRADAKCIEVGTFLVKGDEFLGFTWGVDWKSLPDLHPFCQEMFHNLPETLRHVAEQWPAFRNREAPAWKKAVDPGSLADYYCHTYRHSSFYISNVEEDVPQMGSDQPAPT
jgi:hypothetical protein